MNHLENDIDCVGDRQAFLEGKDITDRIRQKALKLCQAFVQGPWLGVEDHEIQFRKVTGGLSNAMFYCSVPDRIKNISDDPKCEVLIRIYGRLHDEEIAGEVDLIIIQMMSHLGLGPKLFGTFHSGRIEQFIPSKTLTRTDQRVPVMLKGIARTMAAYHCVEAPINKNPNWAFKTVKKNLAEVRKKIDVNTYDEPQRSIAKEMLSFDLEGEVKWLEKTCKTVYSPTVFSHNDLVNLNILAKKSVLEKIKSKPELADDPKTLDDLIVIVDFEWCSYNFRGADIGNHFSEWMYDYDCLPWPGFKHYPNDYPKENEQRMFIREYLAKLNEINNGNLTEYDTEEYMMKELAVYRMVQNLFWSLTAMKLSLDWTIPMGYWEFSKSRYELYQLMKNELNIKTG